VQADHLAADDPVLDSRVGGDRGDVAHCEEPSVLGLRCRMQAQLAHSTEPDATIQERHACSASSTSGPGLRERS